MSCLPLDSGFTNIVGFKPREMWPALKSEALLLIQNITGLTYWTDDMSSEHPTHPYSYYAGIYALLQICALISLLLFGISILIVSVERAGASLHQDALQTLVQAPLSFFTNTDTGVVTNLFSQDLNLIDTELPSATLNTVFSVRLLQLHAS